MTQGCCGGSVWYFKKLAPAWLHQCSVNAGHSHCTAATMMQASHSGPRPPLQGREQVGLSELGTRAESHLGCLISEVRSWDRPRPLLQGQTRTPRCPRRRKRNRGERVSAGQSHPLCGLGDTMTRPRGSIAFTQQIPFTSGTAGLPLLPLFRL